jgi:hypothetical protein
MGALVIPQIGEVYTGTNPAVMKVAKVTFGASSGNPDVAVSAIGTYELLTVPAGCLVIGCDTRVKEAFLGASATFAIGDSDSGVWKVAGTLASTGVTLTKSTTSSIFDATGGGDGKVYDAEQVISVTVGDTAVTAGLAEVYVKYVEAGLL